MTDELIRFSNVGHAYTPARWVFRGYSGTVARGRVLAILGPNGCGKTTLLRLLLGLGRATEGTIERFGRVAFVPQLFQVGFDYSVLDMVLMGRAGRIGLLAQPGRADEAAARDALARFGLEDLARRPFHELSGGQRQLVILARALVAGADLLILDEPASALDLGNQVLILDWIRRLARQEGLGVVFTTHHPHHALAVADRVLPMQDGADNHDAPASEILTEARLRALYGVPLKRVAFEHEGQRHETFALVIPHSNAPDDTTGAPSPDVSPP
ncbi:ABC transporter ATP-binding protein [Pararhodospirillum oryzae]|uniref:Putative ABC transporter ATP-binding protein n=1 Tax=Pararhodospirillum oryzae TaxID=478448 RepID=A0A512HBN0_9PROT|nr:ABC transporter ATP-binding protein [Pararhodospirillum oryzae]GEO82864.1 putative ABC transporter ATP-binding protein [Pararhodospirillum oryzae]